MVSPFARSSFARALDSRNAVATDAFGNNAWRIAPPVGPPRLRARGRAGELNDASQSFTGADPSRCGTEANESLRVRCAPLGRRLRGRCGTRAAASRARPDGQARPRSAFSTTSTKTCRCCCGCSRSDCAGTAQSGTRAVRRHSVTGSQETKSLSSTTRRCCVSSLREMSSRERL
jgi:hypothetical protein